MSQQTGNTPPLVAAGILLRGFVESQLIWGDANHATTLAVVAKVRELTGELNPAALPKPDHFRLLAVQQAVEAIEQQAAARGGNEKVALAFFEAAVENHQGGPRAIDLGGRKVKHKKSAQENFLRAAAVRLWKAHPHRRNALVTEAKQILGIKNRAQLMKMVANHKKNESNPERDSPLTPQMASVTVLSRRLGWSSLKDFLP